MQTSHDTQRRLRHDHGGRHALREQMLLELAKLDITDLRATSRAVTEAAAVLVGVARASLWRFAADELVCEDLFLRDEARHTSGQTIAAATAPAYFAAVTDSVVVAVSDANADARTCELRSTYLGPLGIGAMLDTPVWHPAGPRGILCCEHIGGPRQWSPQEELAAARLADIVARSVEAAERRALEERSRIILDAIPQYVLVVDRDGTVLASSATARRAIAIDAGTSFVERFEDLEIHDLAGALLLRSQWPAERARRGETVRAEIIEMQSRVTGQRRWLRATGAPITIADSACGAVVVYEEVAEEVRIERVKRQFLSAIAHELRTPTTIARGYAQRLMKTPNRPEDEHRALAAIDRATARVARLAEALVDLSSITLGRIVLSMEHVDLSDVALKALQVAPGARTHVVRFVPSSVPARVFVDPLRLRRVLGELVENAARWSSVGSEITVELRVASGFAEVRVTDRGVGIAESAQPHVFEPFFRAHVGASDDLSGLGLGLFLAHEIVNRHGGTLTFESRVGEGTTFFLRVPLDQEGM